MYFFIMFPFPGYVFTLCFLGGPRRPVGRPKKRHFFGAKKRHFFGPKKGRFFARDNTVLFGSSALMAETDTILSANRLEPRISRNQHPNLPIQNNKWQNPSSSS